VQYSKLELPAGEGQLIVMFVNEDNGRDLDVGAFGTALAEDAKARRDDGWRLMSVASMSMRQTGTAGNVLFQSGGQYATQAVLMATYQLV
jgi:hypothetical protein